MANRYPTLYQLLRIISLAFVVLGWLFPQLLQQYGLTLALPLLFLGIPHGATDHLIFRNLNFRDNNRKEMIRFYGSYLGMMAVYAFIWRWSPVVGLGMFLVLSAYHFGQSNWNAIHFNKIARTMLYLFWGSYVIAAPVLWHYTESRPILEAILKTTYPTTPSPWIVALPATLGTILLLAMALLYFKKLISKQVLRAEVTNLIVLSLLFYCTPLLVGFGLYFAGWHSLSSILEQVAFFQTKNPAYKWQQYLRQVMPYTLLAIFGMLAVWGAQESLSVGAHIGLLFLGISLVTLPHMILIELLYAQQPQGAI